MVSPRHIILCTQCYLRRGTCLNAMKRFYFIFTCCIDIPKEYTHIILCIQCYLHRGTCLNAMKRFYFIFLPVVLVFLYSIPGVFCLSGGEVIASSSLKKKLLLL